uniref:Folate transporter 1 n=1 Tax=Ditylenchus dipsaci TaxID=166011 RepID=A0A915ERW9_9BILA
MHWKWAVALTCLYGVLKKLRPATPFLTPFLQSPDFKNFTNDQLYGEIYPYSTYSNLLALIPIFFLSDLLLYKPVILLEALMLCSTWILLIFGTSVTQMQIMQVFFGIATSSDIAYQSYLYAIVHKKHFKRITSYVRTSTMVGKFLSYSFGQLLVSTGLASYLLLNQITLFCMCLAVPIALCLPYVEKSRSDQKQVVLELAAREEENEPLKNEINGDLENSKTTEKDLGFMSKFSVLHKNPTVVYWSIWWVLTSCGMCQVFNYSQTLCL